MAEYIICRNCKRMFCRTSNAICPFCATTVIKLLSKHPPFKQGRRTHVERWIGIQNIDGSISSVTRCSELDCKLNEVKPNSSHD